MVYVVTPTYTSDMFGGALYHVDQVPEHFHELFILSGYRHPRSTARQCIGSMFQPTNETINIWTHFIPALYFLWRIFCVDWVKLGLWDDPYAYPMMAFLCTLSLYPAASCVAHIFNTMSEKARHICFFLDYWALSLYSLGAAIANRAYSFPVNLFHSGFMDAFVWIGVGTALVSFVMSCSSRFLPNGIQKKVFRIAAFSVPYFYICSPIIYRAVLGDDDEWSSGGLYLHLRQGIFAFLSVFLYASHLPERLNPGKFDIVGHSHQIFHVISFIGTHDQLEAMQLDMVGRRSLMEENGMDIHSFSASTLLVVAVGIANLIVMLYFCFKLHRTITISASQCDLVLKVPWDRPGSHLRMYSRETPINGATRDQNNAIPFIAAKKNQ